MKLRRPYWADSFPAMIEKHCTERCGDWYYAKPIELFSVWERIYHAWLVFNDKARAISFAEDRFAKDRPNISQIRI